MEDICLYEIQIHGLVDEDDLNLSSPIGLKLERKTGNSTYFSIRADQAGMVGLIRHIHGLGFLLLSISSNTLDDQKSN